MAIEIERKFLVDKTLWIEQKKPAGLLCVQAYLVNEPDKTVRIRLIGDQSFLTIKGKTVGVSRTEFEYEIPFEEGQQILESFGDAPLEKTRYIIESGKHTWEVDVFHGDNDGLIIAEIELENETEEFIRPNWLGEEVSHDSRYYNACLQNHPYKKW